MATPASPKRQRRVWAGPTPEQELYRPATTAEDAHRTNVHYERPVSFFHRITGGEWNVYSCNLWDGARTDTESQEAKLDRLARLMDLQPGQRILDVGCGWGGPLVYLCRRYGVRGVGLTLSPIQKRDADARIARHGVDAQAVESHWRDYQDEQGFDAIYTDEVIVHFYDLSGFFAKASSLLRSGGRLVNKELHLTSSHHSKITRSMVVINEIYGLTSNYRTLAEELTLLDKNGFELQGVHPIPQAHYRRTMDRWLANMHQHRAELCGLVGREYYLFFRKYVKLARMMISSRAFTLDITVARKP